MKKYILSASFAFMALTGLAQQVGVGFMVGVPRNEFRLATDAEGYGLNVTALFPIGSDVVTIGGNINYQIYGLTMRDRDLVADITF